MRLMFALNMPYSAHGGATKVFRCLTELLGKKNHECRVVAKADDNTMDQWMAQGKQGIETIVSGKVYRLLHQSTQIDLVVDPTSLRNQVRIAVKEMKPDWIVVGAEDPRQGLLEVCLRTAPDRVVYFVQTTMTVPFGPHAAMRTQKGLSLVRQCVGIIAVSDFLVEYTKKWAGCRATRIYSPVFGTGPFPCYENSKTGHVTLVNPCTYKGIDILCALAQKLTSISFAAVPAWGTTQQDKELLTSIPNVHILNPTNNIDNIFSQTRVLLVPSLWSEGFGLVATEAMLRGIPVIASNTGGLTEAKLGIEHILPVNPIENYSFEFDEKNLPIAETKRQPIDIWADTLQKLVENPGHYEELSKKSRNAATSFATGLSVQSYEAFFRGLRHGETCCLESAASSGEIDSNKTGANLPGPAKNKKNILVNRILKKRKREG